MKRTIYLTVLVLAVSIPVTSPAADLITKPVNADTLDGYHAEYFIRIIGNLQAALAGLQQQMADEASLRKTQDDLAWTRLNKLETEIQGKINSMAARVSALERDTYTKAEVDALLAELQSLFGYTPDTGSQFIQISVSGNLSCGLRDDGGIQCWGWDNWGEYSPPPGNFLQISNGGAHSCGIQVDGSIICWGRPGATNPPTGAFIQVAASYSYATNIDHACAIRESGNVACWGDDSYSQSTPPTGHFVQVTAGSGHTCGLRTNGEVECWGRDDYGESTPPSGTFLQISAGFHNTCGVMIDGTVQCWGWEDSGLLTPPSGTFTQVSTGRGLACGVTTDRRVECWGNSTNWYDLTNPPGGIYAEVSAAGQHACGLLTDGSVVCWGDNGSGQATPP